MTEKEPDASTAKVDLEMTELTDFSSTGQTHMHERRPRGSSLAEKYEEMQARTHADIAPEKSEGDSSSDDKSDSASSGSSEKKKKAKKNQSSSDSSGDCSDDSVFDSSSDEDESENSDEDGRTRGGVTVRTLTKEELQKSKLLIQNQVLDSKPEAMHEALKHSMTPEGTEHSSSQDTSNERSIDEDDDEEK